MKMSNGRHCFSGSQHRKRKAKKEADLKKQSGSLKKFFEHLVTNTAQHFDNVTLQDNIISKKLFL